VVNSFQAIRARARRYAGRGIEEALVLSKPPLLALTGQAIDRIPEQLVGRAVGVADGSGPGARIALADAKLGQVLRFHHCFDEVQIEAM